jgi:hypothetical protein
VTLELCGFCGKPVSGCICDQEALAVRESRLARGGGEQQNRIVACAGRKGSGKSRLSREILQQIRRLFMYDTMGEHRWIPDSFEEQDKAIIYLMESYQYGEFMARYVPETDDEESDFSEICNVVYEQGNMLFAIEEVVMLGCSPNYAPPKFKRLMRLGRHRNVDMLYTTQRLSECPRALTAATDVFILFAHSEPKDLDRIQERCGVEVARLVANFQDHEFLIWDVNQKTLTRQIDCGSTIVPISSPQLKIQSARPQLTA